jgi:hypothetical protein
MLMAGANSARHDLVVLDAALDAAPVVARVVAADAAITVLISEDHVIVAVAAAGIVVAAARNRYRDRELLTFLMTTDNAPTQGHLWSAANVSAGDTGDVTAAIVVLALAGRRPTTTSVAAAAVKVRPGGGTRA